MLFSAGMLHMASSPDDSLSCVTRSAVHAALRGRAPEGSDAITWLLAQPASVLADVELGLRGSRFWQPHIPTLPTPSELQAMTPSLRQATLFVASAEADGHRRQACVQRLPSWPGHLALSAALLRCNDWVAQVREAAQEAVMTLLAQCAVADIVTAWPLATRLRRAGRVDLDWLHRRLDAWISSPAQRPVLGALLQHADARTRLVAHTLALAGDTEWAQALRARAVLDPDPHVARLALQHLLDHASAAQVETHCRRALSSPSGQVRSRALRALAERNVEDVRAIAETAAFDRSCGVRRLAAWLLQQRHGATAAHLWRVELDTGSRGRWREALSGLADHADAEDAARMQALLPSVGLRHRRNCFRGWIRAEGGVTLAILQASLGEDDRTIQAEISLASQDWTGALDAAVLGALWRDGLDAAQQARLQQRLRRALPLWRHLALLLDYAPAPLAEREWHARLVEAWLAASAGYSPLTPERRQALLRRVQQGPHILPATAAERIAHAVQHP